MKKQLSINNYTYKDNLIFFITNKNDKIFFLSIIFYTFKPKNRIRKMLQSMTGYGKSVVTIKSSQYQIEIKTLNSKTLDLNFKLPFFLKERELEIRQLLSEHLIRGKIDFSVFSERFDVSSDALGSISVIDKDKFLAYYKSLETLSGELGLSMSEKNFALALKMPSVITQQNNSQDNTLSEEELNQILSHILLAVESCKKTRQGEGAKLLVDISTRVDLLSTLYQKVVNLDPLRLEDKKNRLRSLVEDNKNIIDVDRNRFEQELIYYFEKLDITEEKVRFASHISFFKETLKEVGCGKKLGFILQELGREINTTGSKCNNAEMQQIVTELKDELEKMKEQILNIL